MWEGIFFGGVCTVRWLWLGCRIEVVVEIDRRAMEQQYLPVPGSWQDWVSLLSFGAFVAFIAWQVYTTKAR